MQQTRTGDFTIQMFHPGLGWVDLGYPSDLGEAIARAKAKLRDDAAWSPGLRCVRVLKDGAEEVYNERA